MGIEPAHILRRLVRFGWQQQQIEADYALVFRDDDQLQLARAPVVVSCRAHVEGVGLLARVAYSVVVLRLHSEFVPGKVIIFKWNINVMLCSLFDVAYTQFGL